MKIMRVRLCNLASLQGEFTVDFEGPVLGGAPLFAITGRTGSGKSTLLDAICLGLYGKTPRYDAGRSTAAEIDGIRGDDERNILRRGAGKGWAETDYLGRDGHRYRARWEVQRARERAGGNLQNARKNLWKVTGTNGGETLELIADRGEVTARVEQTLGLSFSQFRHAVLLAQGEFQAFLEAKDAERSQLLETITGTDIYSRLSREANRRKAESESRLRELEQAGAGITILPDEARAQLELDLDLLRRREADLGGEREALQRWLAWHDEDARKAEALARVQSDYEAMERAIRDRAADFARLRDWEALEPIRIAWARMQERAQHREKAETKKGELQGRRERQEASLAELATAEEVTRQELAAARAALEAARPALLEARRLDGQCEQAERLAAEATTNAAALAAKLEQATRDLAQLERDLSAKQEAVERERQWLAQREALRAVLEGHEACVRRLETLRGLLGELDAKDAELAELRRQEAACRQDWETAGRESAAAGERLAAHRVELESAREALRGLEPAALRERERWLLERAGLLEGARREQEDLARQTDELAGLEREITDRTDRLRQAETRLPALTSELETARQEAGVLRQALEKLNRALASDLEGLRAALEDGQPCPLCGSTQHPWAERAVLTALNEQLGEMQSRLAQCEAAGQRANDALREQHACEAACQAGLQQLGGQRDQLQARIQESSRRLEAARQGLDDPRPLAEQLEVIRLERESVAEGLKEVARLEGSIAGLQTQCDGENRNGEALEKRVRALEQKRDNCSAQGRLCEQALEGLQKQRGELAEELRGAFTARPAWMAALEHDIPGLVAELQREAEDYRRKRLSLGAEESELRQLQNRQAGEAAGTDALRRQGAQAEAERRQRGAEKEAARGKRAALLEGEPADRVEERLSERARQAEEGLASLLSARAEARMELGELDGTLHQLEEELARARDEVEQARAEVREFCGRQQSTMEQIGETLTLGKEWVEDTRREREALARTAATLKGQTEALRGQLDGHRLAPPPHPREECTARMGALDEESQRLGSDKEAALGQLLTDNENRKRLGRMREQLEAAREEARVWQTLGEAIGSADGKKFRSYAQGLTLRVLMAHANAQLRQLRPRFSLRQNDKAAMDLVLVDHDLGGEVRTVRSLSGGESFLVSLALALGLSNMAARDLSIDSLFIDEGFGTLDADTLQMAIAVLQGLHAQGKQVGIISHVEGIAQQLGAEVRVETVDPGQSRLCVTIAC